ncbi:MAG: RIP metalloprotease RseP [Lachnospiraceae bacterium]|nr:RIP metalloprotease RseP [Lachnospiraceae bacterium]
MGIILFFVIFCVVVIVHEFGHMIIAKANGIGVVEFTVGMGPTLFHYKKGETKNSVRLFPIGGACIFEGEDGLSSGVADADRPVSEQVMDRVETLHENKRDAEQSKKAGESYVRNTELGKKGIAFPDAKVSARIATVLAGPVFNFLLAFLFSLIIVGSYGSDLPVVEKVIDGGAAQQAGMQDGDTIISMNGKKIHLYREVSFASLLNKGEDITVVYERDGQQYATVISPIYDENAGRYYMGFYGSNVYKKQGVWGTVKYSAYEVKYWIDTTLKSLEMLVRGQVSRNDVSGPVGMAQQVNTIYTESKPDGIFYVWLNMLNFAILLSANLGVLNLLPLPALDGGRLVFLIIEAIRRKPVPAEKEGMVHFAGFVLLMLLMVVVFFNDISRLFS